MTRNQPICLLFIEPSSAEVSVAGNDAGCNLPKLIYFLFSQAVLPAVCADCTSDNRITFARRPHPLCAQQQVLMAWLDMTASQSQHIMEALRGVKTDLFGL